MVEYILAKFYGKKFQITRVLLRIIALLENLTTLGVPVEFHSFEITATTAKLRLLHFVVPDARSNCDSLMEARTGNLRRPLVNWHSSCFYAALRLNAEIASAVGVTQARASS